MDNRKLLTILLGSVLLVTYVAPLGANDGSDVEQVANDDGLALKLPAVVVEADGYVPLHLCDVDDAMEAGLDVGDLDAEWASLGIDCATSQMRVTRAQVANDSLVTDGIPTDAEIQDLLDLDRAVARKIDRHLGIRNESSYATNRSDRTKGNTIAIVEDSLSLDENGTVRGLIRNQSERRSFKRVIVRLRDSAFKSERLRLDIQPGELFPFEISTDLSELPDSDRFRVTASNSAQSERGLRSLRVHVSGARPYEVSDMPATYSDLGSRTSDGYALATTGRLVVEQPSNGQVVRRVRKPVAHIAFLDAHGAVIEVETLVVAEIQDSGELQPTSTLERRDPHAGLIGFVEPEGSSSFIIWAGGEVK